MGANHGVRIGCKITINKTKHEYFIICEISVDQENNPKRKGRFGFTITDIL